MIARGTGKGFQGVGRGIPRPDLLIAGALLFVDATAEDDLARQGGGDEKEQNGDARTRIFLHIDRDAASGRAVWV